MSLEPALIEPTPPFDFGLTAGHLTYFRGRYGSDSFENEELRHVTDVGGKIALTTVRSIGSVDAPRLEMDVAGEGLEDGDVEAARGRTAWALGAYDDVQPFYEIALKDPHLPPLVKAMRGLHITRASPYEAIIQAILGQQISSHVARMLRSTLIETYGPRATIDGRECFAFPSPEALANAGVDALRSIKFSQRKAEYVTDISAMVASGRLDLDGLRGRSTEDVVESLTAIRGVGPWTAHWLMIRALGHTDGFPYGDIALQKAVGMLVKGGNAMSADEILEYSERWSPYRSYVTVYLFAAMRSGRLEELVGSGTRLAIDPRPDGLNVPIDKKERR